MLPVINPAGGLFSCRPDSWFCIGSPAIFGSPRPTPPNGENVEPDGSAPSGRPSIAELLARTFGVQSGSLTGALALLVITLVLITVVIGRLQRV